MITEWTLRSRVLAADYVCIGCGKGFATDVPNEAACPYCGQKLVQSGVSQGPPVPEKQEPKNPMYKHSPY